MPDVQSGNSPEIWFRYLQKQVYHDGVLFQWTEQNKHTDKQ